MRAVILVVLTVLAAAWLTDSALRPPSPQSSDIAVEAFSAQRASADLPWIANAPHPVGSPALRVLRERLVDRLQGLGLDVQTQPSFAVDARSHGDRGDVVAGNVENVIAVLHGQDRSAPALLVMAHIDSVPHSPGAADDGIGVVTMIEMARALKTGAVPQRDVIFLFTDSEEAGLLGARAFFDQHPLAARVGALLNLDARGSRGRTVMFETGPDNAGMVALYARNAALPSASSLSAFAYRHMPNSTDFTVALSRQIPGLNFAIIENQFDYHAASSTVANLDLGSLQHMGDQVLAAGRELAYAQSLPTPGANVVYSDLLGRWLIHYPAWVGWILLALAALSIGIAGRRLRGRGSDVLREIGLSLYVLVVTALALRLGYRLLGGTASARLSEARSLLAGFEPFMLGAAAVALAVAVLACIGLLRGRGGWLALIALAVGAACSVTGLDLPALIAAAVAGLIALAGFRRQRGMPGVGLGIAIFVFLLALVAQTLAPELTPILIWPLLVGSLSLFVFGRRLGTPLIVLLAVVSLAFVAQFGQGVLVALGFGMPEVAALPTMLGLLFLYPLLATTMHPLALGERRARHAMAAAAPLAMGGLLLLIGIACWASVALRPAGDARYPAISQVIHVSDVVSQRDRRVSALNPLDDWSAQALSADGGTIARGELRAAFLPTIWQADTPAVSAEPTGFVLAADESQQRRVLTITPPADGRELRLLLRSSKPLGDVRLNGVAVELMAAADASNYLRLFPGGAAVELSWAVAGASIEIEHAAISDHWPSDAEPLPERPRNVMPWGMSDSHVVIGVLKLEG